jgi:PAS domain S-box-containing protein
MGEVRGPGTDQWLRTAIESSPSGLLMTDREGIIVLVNREVERLFGYSREELLGKSVEALVPARHRGRHVKDRHGFTAQPEVRAMGAGRDLHGLRKDGTEVPVEIGLTPVQTADGLFILGAIVDISARKQAEKERRRLMDELRQAQKVEALGMLAGGVAHDFNNILGAITGYGELVRDRSEDAQCRRDADQILTAAERGRQIIAKILRFTRRQSSEYRLTELAGPIREAAALLRSTIPSTIEMRIDLSPATPEVYTDSTAIHQILVNLGTNAAQAMADGGERRRQMLTISLQPFFARDSAVRGNPELREGPYALLEVADTGGGMTAEVLARAFEPFYTTKAAGKGTGLGLATVRSLLRDHGGTVEIDTEIARGTRVRCYIPAVDIDTSTLVAAAPALAAPAGRGERIYYVDDQAELVQVGVRRLASLGYDAQGFTDPLAVLAAIEADPIACDLLITDYSMPRLDGLKLVRAVLAIRADLPVLLMTGWTEHLTEEDIAAAGVRSLLLKPATTIELATSVRTLLAEATGRKEIE